MQAYEFIEGYEQVVARFGVWPSFHDGEVLRIILDRVPRLPDGASVPSVEIHLRGWIMGPEFSEDGNAVSWACGLVLSLRSPTFTAME